MTHEQEYLDLYFRTLNENIMQSPHLASSQKLALAVRLLSEIAEYGNIFEDDGELKPKDRIHKRKKLVTLNTMELIGLLTSIERPLQIMHVDTVKDEIKKNPLV